MPDFDIRCAACGCEDVELSFETNRATVTFTCASCHGSITLNAGCPSCSTRQSSKRNFRPKVLHEEIHAVAQKGRVYFIAAEDETAPVKIGYTSTDTSSRVKVLQTGHPHKLTVLAEIEGGYRLETALHRIFASQRLYGEWFNRTPELDGLIAALSE